MSLRNVPRCQHIKVNGTQCGSPALRRRRNCFFHDSFRRAQAKIAAQAAPHGFELPLLEDSNSVQVALMKVIQMLGSGLINHKTAGLVLYALQTASSNLRNADFEPEEVSDIVIDRNDVHRTCINGPQWFKSDFEDEAEEEDGAENETEGEPDAEVAALVEAAGPRGRAFAAKLLAEAMKVSPQQAPIKAQAVIRDGSLETSG